MSESASAAFGPYKPTRVLAYGGQSKVWLCDGPSGVVVVKSARDVSHRKAIIREAVILQKAPHPKLASYLAHAPDGA